MNRMNLTMLRVECIRLQSLPLSSLLYHYHEVTQFWSKLWSFHTLKVPITSSSILFMVPVRSNNEHQLRGELSFLAANHDILYCASSLRTYDIISLSRVASRHVSWLRP